MFSDCPFCNLRHKTTILYYTTRDKKKQHIFNKCEAILRGKFSLFQRKQEWRWGGGHEALFSAEKRDGLPKTGKRGKIKRRSYPKRWKFRIFFGNFEISLAFFDKYRYTNKHPKKECLKTERHRALAIERLATRQEKERFGAAIFMFKRRPVSVKGEGRPRGKAGAVTL